MKKVTFLLIVILVSSYGFAQNYNRPIPSETFPYEFQNSGTGLEGFYLTTNFKVNVPQSNPNFIAPYPAIYDETGYIAWYSKPNVINCTDFKYYADEDLYSYSVVESGPEVKFVILDGNLNRIDTLNVQIHEEDIHDLQRAANGNWLLGAKFMDTMDLSAYSFDGVQGNSQTVIRGFGVQEIDANGNVVFEWNSNDFMHPSETYDFYGYNANDFDYCHGNAIEEDTDGNLLFSMRHTNSIIKVDRTTGAIIWRLGGQLSDFTFVNGTPFSAQHDIRKLPNGNYSLYNNDNMGPQESRGEEYTLDTVNWTATKVYEYIHPDANYHRAMGCYRYLPNDYKLMGWGFSYRPSPNATIVDDQDNVVSEYYFEDSVMMYRIVFDDAVTLPRPEIICVDTGNGYELTVNPAASYQWSTGSTSQSIPLTVAGTYQVWVPFGEGFVGSFPFTVTDPNNPCSLGIEALNLDSGAFKWCNLLGQEIQHPKKGTLYLKIFENGHIEKVIFQ
ncbi:MAG: hypothetical protein Crog4KO_17200 [Crocinitomicaceae bacterium]